MSNKEDLQLSYYMIMSTFYESHFQSTPYTEKYINMANALHHLIDDARILGISALEVMDKDAFAQKVIEEERLDRDADLTENYDFGEGEDAGEDDAYGRFLLEEEDYQKCLIPNDGYLEEFQDEDEYRTDETIDTHEW